MSLRADGNIEGLVMVFIDPDEFSSFGFETEVERIMRQLSKSGKATSHNTKLPTLMGQKYKDIFGEMIDVSRTNYRRKKNKVYYNTIDDDFTKIAILPKIVFNKTRFHLKRLKF